MRILTSLPLLGSLGCCRLLEEDKNLPKELKVVTKSRCGGDKKALDAVFISLLLEALQGDSKAAKELLDRGYGKVADAVELSGPGGGPIPSRVDISASDALVAAVAQAIKSCKP